MLGFLVSFGVIGFGAVFGSDLLIGVGIGGVVLIMAFEFIKPQPRLARVEERAPRYKHKLIDAPEDAWESNDAEAIMMAMKGGPGGNLMQGPGGDLSHMLGTADPFKSMFSKKGYYNGMEGRRARDFLPFPQYGRQSVLEQVFIGLPVSIKSIFDKGRGK